MDRDLLRLDLAIISVSKHLNLVEKISKLCGREQCQPEGFTVHVIFGMIFVFLSDYSLRPERP